MLFKDLGQVDLVKLVAGVMRRELTLAEAPAEPLGHLRSRVFDPLHGRVAVVISAVEPSSFLMLRPMPGIVSMPRWVAS